MVSKGTLNPFNINRTAPMRHRAGEASLLHQSSPEEITRTELKRYLYSKNRSQEVNPKLQRTYERFLQDGNSFSYLLDTSLASEFNIFVQSKLSEGDLQLAATLCSESGVLKDHLVVKNLPEDSLPNLLINFIQKATEALSRGTDLKANPISLIDSNSRNPTQLVEILTTKDNGLTSNSPALRDLQKNDDPILQLIYQMAVKYGLHDSIHATKKSLRLAEQNHLTDKLNHNLKDVLKKEYEQLNQILLPDGSLVVNKLDNGRVVVIPSIQLSPEQLESLGDDKRHFLNCSRVDFREFFESAHKLAILGDDQGLTKLVSDNMSLIMTYYNLRWNDPNEINNRAKFQEEFSLLSRNIQGNGLIPTTIAKIIREKVIEASLSSDFLARACAGHEDSYSKSSVLELVEFGSSSETTSHPSLNGFIDSSGIEIMLADGKKSKHKLVWIENSQIPTIEEQQDNNNLVADKAISIERAVRSYSDEIKKHINYITTTLEPILNQTSTNDKSNGHTRLTIEKNLLGLEPFSRIVDISDFIKTQLELISKNRNHETKDNIQKALNNFSCSFLGLKDHNLFNVHPEYSKIRSLIENITSDLINGDRLGSNVKNLILELKNIKKVDEKSTRAFFNDLNGKNSLRALFNSCISENNSDNKSFKLLDFISLNEISSIFQGPIGNQLANIVESTAQEKSIQEIIMSSGHPINGGFANLLFAEDSHSQPDPEKRIIALLALIRQASQDDKQMEKITEHIINKLRISPILSSEQTDMCKSILCSAAQKIADPQLKRLVTMKDRLFYLSENLVSRQRELDGIREKSTSIIIRNFGSEKQYEEYRNSLKKIHELATRINQDSPDCLKDLINELNKDNDLTSLKIVNHLSNRLEANYSLTNPASTDPRDSLISMTDFIERLLCSRNLVTFGKQLSA